MSSNKKYLDDTRVLIVEFEKELDPDKLLEAFGALQNVVLAKEAESGERQQVRRGALVLWLALFEAAHRHVDDGFNPDDVPELNIQPPATSGGVVYPPGADPALIDDPAARKKYEIDIAESRRKAVWYRLQTTLRRTNGRIRKQLRDFIVESYTQTESDQNEMFNTIEATAPSRTLTVFLRGFLAQRPSP